MFNVRKRWKQYLFLGFDSQKRLAWSSIQEGKVQPGVVAHTYNPSIRGWGQEEQEFKGSLGYKKNKCIAERQNYDSFPEQSQSSTAGRMNQSAPVSTGQQIVCLDPGVAE